MYEVIRKFLDVETDHVYNVGDTYPISGHKPTKNRIEKLLKGNNNCGHIYLKEVKSPNK